MSNQDKYERLDAWLRGELAGADKDEFEKLLDNDQALAREAKFQKDLNKSLSETKAHDFRNALKVAVAEYHIEETKQGQGKIVQLSPNSTARIFPLRRVLSLAAGVALLVAAAIWLMREPIEVDQASLFAKNFVPPSGMDFAISSGTKGGENGGTLTEIEQLKKDAQNAYDNKDYQNALNILERIPPGNLSTDELRVLNYQLGVLYLITGKEDKANEFLSMENAAEPELRQWYRAMLLLKQNASKEEIKAALLPIVKSTKHPWQKEAKVIYDQIGKMD